MVSSVEVEFVGGLIDGQRRVLQCDAQGLPPVVLKFEELPPVNWATKEMPPPVELVFRREVNPADDGALWLYRLVP